MTQPYHKIMSLWKRDSKGRLIPYDWSRPELGFLADLEWEWTEKVDGTNIRLSSVDNELQIQGRTDRAQIPPFLEAAIREYGDLTARMADVFDEPESVTLYGEGYGAKIQKGGKYRYDQGFVLFDVKVGPWWLDRDAVDHIARELKLRSVPVVMRGRIQDAIDTVAAGMKSQWGDFIAEGLVGRPAVPLFNRKGDRVIVKVKYKDFARLKRDGISWEK